MLADVPDLVTPRFPDIRPLGDTAVTVRFGAGIDPAIHARVLGFARALEAQRARFPGIVEWLPAFDSVSVYFDLACGGPAWGGSVGGGQACADPDEVCAALLALARSVIPEARPGRRWRIPVCFDAQHAPDLAELAAAGGIDTHEAIRLLTSAVFRVYMLGFLPGFPYMGGLPRACDQPRRVSPRKLVPARSLAAAAGMCAIYPWDSPGGWHLIGRTPVRPFELGHAEGPALFAAGDEVRLQPITGSDYDCLERDAAAERLSRVHLLDGDER